jgi:AraC-like DNA-binding protein
MEVNFQKFSPAAALKPYIDSFWYFRFDGPPGTTSPLQRCLPSGMAQMIFQLHPNRPSMIVRERPIVLPEAYVVGLHREPVTWAAPGGGAGFGISIRPEGFIRLFRQSFGEMVDGFIDFKDFFGHALDPLTEQVQTAPDNSARQRLLEDFFVRQLQQPQQPQEGGHYLLEALRKLRKFDGNHSIETLSEQVFIGKRQLQRTFREFFGLTPKQYGRILRFRSAYDFLLDHPQARWSDVTYDFGYTDQSHFIRDFKEFTGANPTLFKTDFTSYSTTPLAFARA